MKYKEITYKRSFKVKKFTFETIGAVAIIEELDQRHIPDCYDELKDMLRKVHNETLKKG